MAAKRVELFFDVVSPYTHLQLHSLAKYQKAWPSLALTLRPMFLGGIMKATGNKPPGVLKPKAAWMANDLRTASELSGTPMLPMPKNFFSEVARAVVYVQRLQVAAQLDGLGKAEQFKLALACSDCIHAESSLRTASSDLQLGDEFMAAVLAKSGIEAAHGKALLDKTGEAAVKQALIQNTDEAVSRGVFGSPTMFATEDSSTGKMHMLFGSDRMEQLAHVLDLPYLGAAASPKSAPSRASSASPMEDRLLKAGSMSAP
jgi:glutathione S-transferase kappa 1